MAKTKITEKTKKEAAEVGTCSLCGHLYKNFAFKGGYICENCLLSIKEQQQSDHDEEK